MRTSTSSWPSRPCVTATSPGMARRSRWCGRLPAGSSRARDPRPVPDPVFLAPLLAIAGSFGAWFDATLVTEAASDEDLGLQVDVRRPFPGSVATARLLPHALTAIVFVVAAAQMFAVAYAEATSPGAPTTPFVLRV